MSSRKLSEWNLFVRKYYAEHKGSHKSLKHVAKLYKEHKVRSSEHRVRSSEHNTRGSKATSSKASREHSSHPANEGPKVIKIEYNCKVCDAEIPEVFTQEPLCELDVSKSNPIVRYSVFGKEYCALASNLIQYFDTKLVVDSVGIRTRTGRTTTPVGQKRGPIEPYSRLPFSKADYQLIKKSLKK